MLGQHLAKLAMASLGLLPRHALVNFLSSLAKMCCLFSNLRCVCSSHSAGSKLSFADFCLDLHRVCKECKCMLVAAVCILLAGGSMLQLQLRIDKDCHILL